MKLKRIILAILLVLFVAGQVQAFPPSAPTPAATTTKAGKVELATDAETVTGTSDAVVTTPGNITARLAEPGTIGGTTPGPAYFTTLQGYYQSVGDKTDTYVITSADFGKSLRMTSGSDKIFTAPSVGASEDGARITLEKLGAGKVTFDCADSDTVADSGAGDTIYNGEAAETYSTITLEYVHSVTKWVIVAAHGTWTTTD